MKYPFQFIHARILRIWFFPSPLRDTQLNVRGVSLRDVHVWSVDNATLNVAFDRRAHGLLQLDSWVNIKHLAGPNARVQDCLLYTSDAADE